MANGAEGENGKLVNKQRCRMWNVQLIMPVYAAIQLGLGRASGVHARVGQQAECTVLLDFVFRLWRIRRNHKFQFSKQIIRKVFLFAGKRQRNQSSIRLGLSSGRT